jgi:hypothetical protein
MLKLKEMVGRSRKLGEDFPVVGRTKLKPGMKVKIQDAETIYKNHYYENFPEKYKKLAQQIAGTIQEIEEVKPLGLIESNSIKLVGFDVLIEVDDIEKLVKVNNNIIEHRQNWEPLNYIWFQRKNDIKAFISLINNLYNYTIYSKYGDILKNGDEKTLQLAKQRVFDYFDDTTSTHI